ncbi:MAG: hypothetical protein K940chlam9_01009 [Chlamydiae bacterium]|nr:hypothetical protein [Chlamydiota bacterium]
MKKFFILGAFLCGILGFQQAEARGSRNNCCQDRCCKQEQCRPERCQPEECCAEEATGECYCEYVRYEPRHYTTTRCVEEQVPCPRTCCRYVPEYYEVQKCRYVPEYYCETKCRMKPEYYEVCDYKCVKRTICEPQCEYVPKYYWKHSCCNSHDGGMRR